jgi:hypothetical protein
MIPSILYLAKYDLPAKLPGFSFRQHTVLITSFPAPPSISIWSLCSNEVRIKLGDLLDERKYFVCTTSDLHGTNVRAPAGQASERSRAAARLPGNFNHASMYNSRVPRTTCRYRLESTTHAQKIAECL